MSKIIMIYFLEKGNDAKRFRFNRALFPYKIQSHSGKYSRKSQGILHDYDKITKSVILFDEKYYNSVINLVKELSVDAKFFTVKEKL